MEFGKLDDIRNVKWALPADDPRNGFPRDNSRPSQILFGSPAWANKHWLGKIYPKDATQDQFLYHYSRNFNCIELNTTHYRIPSEVTVQEWLSQVPSSFIFCPKVYKEISHTRFGLGDKSQLSAWFKFLENIRPNLGSCFIQFHEKFSYGEKAMLFQFLENWPKEFELCIEFRHPSWFQEHTILPALTDYLRKKGIGLVITDVAGRRDVLHTTVTTNWTMIRIIGNDLDPSDESRLHDWAGRLQNWKLEKTYFILHQPDDIWTIEYGQMAERVFSKHGFMDLPKFEFVKPWDLLHL